MSKDSQQAKYIKALIRERDGYLGSGLSQRAAEVDAELQKYAEKASPPARRATSRVTKGPERRA